MRWILNRFSAGFIFSTVKRQIHKSQIQILEALHIMNESQLYEIAAQRKSDFQYLIYRLMQHDFYYPGQIVFIKNN
jgi:hypothetical protein